MKFVKIASVSLALVLGGCVLTACRGGSDVVINEGMVQLLVGNFDGGYGTTWFNDVKERFEAKYADYDFGNGKVGVQIIADHSDRYSGAVDTKISGWAQHVILAENLNYYNLTDIDDKTSRFIQDITDVVTTPLNYDMITGQTDTSLDEGEETMESIMNDSMRNYLNVAGSDTYFAVPFYEATVGVVYDIDLFERYGFYYAADGYGKNGFIQDENGNWIGENGKVLGNVADMTFTEAKAAGMKLSDGPDDETGTYDDGMPATYDEFFALCQWINDRGVIPLTWPGTPEAQRYLNYLAYNLWTDFEGVQQMSLNFSLNGRATDLIDMDSYNPQTGTYTTYEEDITNANGYLLQQQAGKFEGINFIYELVSDPDYYDEQTCFSDTSQAEAERRFLLSALPDQQDRAMLIDGSWWQNEARNIFEDMAVDYGEQYSAANRRFGMMPLPKANETKVGDPSTLAFNTATLIFINKRTTTDPVVLKVAKQFIKFMHTHESLYKFNEITGSAKPYDYTLTETELAGMTSVARQNYELHSATEFVFTYSQNPIVRKYPERFSSSGYLVFQAGGNLYEILSPTFNNNKGLTGWAYFKSMVEDHGATFWQNNFASDIG